MFWGNVGAWWGGGRPIAKAWGGRFRLLSFFLLIPYRTKQKWTSVIDFCLLFLSYLAEQKFCKVSGLVYLLYKVTV